MNFTIGILFGVAIGYILGRTGDKPEPENPALLYTADMSGIKIIGEFTDMNLREGQKVDLEVMPQTASGRPGAIEAGSARWTSSDESVVSITQDRDNPLKATARGLDGSNNESVVIEFRADGDQDPGDDQIKEIIGTLPITCTQGDATTVQLSAGDPVDDVAEVQPPPTEEPAPTEPPTGEPGEPVPPVDETPGEPVPPSVPDENVPTEPTPPTENPAEPPTSPDLPAEPETPGEPLPDTPTEPVPVEPETGGPVDPAPPIPEPDQPNNF